MNEFRDLEAEGGVQSNIKTFDPKAAQLARQKRESDNQKSRDAILDRVEPMFEILGNPDADFKTKLDIISRLQKETLPSLFQELGARVPDTDRSLVASRTIMAIGAMSKTLLERRAADAAEEIDPHSPKFQLVLGWFIELLHEAMKSQSLDSIVINNTFQDLSSRLAGWEDLVAKRLKGVSAKALGTLKNPFVESFWDQTRRATEERNRALESDE